MQVLKNVSAQIAILLIALLAIAPFAMAKTTTNTHKKSTSTIQSTTSKKTGKTSSHSKRGKKRAAKKSWKTKGQKTIASERTREIQEALIKQGYLDGEANGVWDTRTQEACRKLQADNGWQTKVLPDSRALIKLGLGPDHKDVLNPETAATSPYLPGGGVKESVVPAAAAVPER